MSSQTPVQKTPSAAAPLDAAAVDQWAPSIDSLFDDLCATYRLSTCMRLARLLKAVNKAAKHPVWTAEAIRKRLASAKDDGHAARAAGQLLFQMGEASAAGDSYARLVTDPTARPSPQWMVEAAVALDAAGRARDAQQVTTAVIKAMPIVTRPIEKPAASLLIIRDLTRHSFNSRFPTIPSCFGGDGYPSQIAFDDIQLSYGIFNAKAFPDLARRLRPDVTLCNFTGLARRPATFVDDFDAIMAELGCGVLNHPRALLACTRDANYRRLAGQDGMLFPRTEALTVHAGDLEATVADLESRFDYPIIVRPQESQFGRGMVLAGDTAALRDALGKSAGAPIYAIQYYQCRRDWADRAMAFRAALIGDRLLPIATFRFPSWSTHAEVTGQGDAYRRDVLLNDRRFIEEDRAFVEEFEREVSPADRAALKAAMATTGLDIVGMDFGRAADGSLVGFEINPFMLLFFEGERGAQMPHYRASDARVRAAMADLVHARAARRN